MSRRPARLDLKRLPIEIAHLPRPTVENVLPFYLQKSRDGQRVCLVTQFNVDTVAPRPVGSQMAIAEDGEYFGFITGGCAESAIVHEAIIAINERQSRSIRIGSDSPWFDIKLPCGAGIDLHFSVADSVEVFEDCCEQLSKRRSVKLSLDLAKDQWEIVRSMESDEHSSRQLFCRTLQPTKRIVVVGAGPYVDALAMLAENSEFDVLCLSPEFESNPESESRAEFFCLPNRRRPLSRSTDLPIDELDPWTAVVFLFHEHDWEPKLLKQALETDCFYVGALGSRGTHANRLSTLRQLGVAEELLQRIRGPVGLGIGAKTPAEIAISILAEIVATHRMDFAGDANSMSK